MSRTWIAAVTAPLGMPIFHEFLAKQGDGVAEPVPHRTVLRLSPAHSLEADHQADGEAKKSAQWQPTSPSCCLRLAFSSRIHTR